MKKYRKPIIQILAFLLFADAFIINLQAIQNLIEVVRMGDARLLAEPLVILASTMISTLLFGRYFCGYLCSFGAMQDLIWFLSKHTIHFSKRIPPKADKALKHVKGLLLLALIICWILAIKLPDELNPWSAFGLALSIRDASDLSRIVSVGGLILLMIVVMSFFIERFFCHYVCPLGAAFHLVRKLNFRREKMHCGNAGECSICNHKCPKEKTSVPALVVTVLLFAAANLWLAYGPSDMENANDLQGEASDIEQKQQEASAFADGEYEGSAPAYRGDMTVAVTVVDGEMTDIEIISSRDDASYLNKVKERLIPQILDKQSIEVDAISGATYSSEGLKNAVRNALGIVEQKEDGQDTVSDIEAESMFDVSDGTYRGSAEGFYGPLEVEVTVEDGKVADVDLISYYDTEEYLFHAAPVVFTQVCESQSLNVDAVSGATYSRNGLVNAIANAFGIDANAYEMVETPERTEKHAKKKSHKVQKFIDSDEQYEELVEKYRKVQLERDGKISRAD